MQRIGAAFLRLLVVKRTSQDVQVVFYSLLRKTRSNKRESIRWDGHYLSVALLFAYDTDNFLLSTKTLALLAEKH
ncbi:MAG: hypothetical protein AAGK47_06240, partial [Bacteroidota bacterium]